MSLCYFSPCIMLAFTFDEWKRIEIDAVPCTPPNLDSHEARQNRLLILKGLTTTDLIIYTLAFSRSLLWSPPRLPQRPPWQFLKPIPSLPPCLHSPRSLVKFPCPLFYLLKAAPQHGSTRQQSSSFLFSYSSRVSTVTRNPLYPARNG